MKDKNISVGEYAFWLGCAGLLTMLFVLAMFAGGAYAVMKLFHLHWYSGVALFLLCVVIWSRKPKAK